MKYPTGSVLQQELDWYENKYAPVFHEATINLHRLKNGQFLKRKFIIGRGERLAEWFGKALRVEQMLKGLG